MATTDVEHPVEQIKEHFESVFHSKQAEKEMQEMAGLLGSLGCEGECAVHG